MATIAGTYSGTRGSAKAPISTHPAFPAIVALWFAALLGLGSLVLPVALVERLVTITGIASLVPAAAPPLGFTARAIIALSASIGGATLGLLLARQVARPRTFEPSARKFGVEDGRPRRPISVHDELEEEGLAPSAGGQPLLAKKRRTLAMTEDNRRSTYLPAIPLPGQSEEEPHDFDEPVVALPEASPVTEPVTEPLELGTFADEGGESDEVAAPGPALELLRSQIHIAEHASAQDHPMIEHQELHSPLEQPEARASEDSVVPQPFEPARNAHDPLPFAAPSLRRAEPAPFDEEDMDEPEDQPTREEAPVHLSVIESTDVPDGDDDRPLDELGLVQLAARLGASLEKRRSRAAGPPPAYAAPVAAPLAEDFEVAEADDAARAIADFFGPSPAVAPVVDAVLEPEAEPVPAAPTVPASMRTLSFDVDEADDEEALEASFSLPLSKGAEPARSLDDDEEADEDDDGDYSSLLAMKNPFVRQEEFVRVEEPETDGEMVEPTVTFPSPAPPAQAAVADPGEPAQAAARPFDPPKQAPESATPSAAPAPRRDPGDAERSLRDALATLQRMSGAA